MSPLPSRGLPRDELFDRLAAFRDRDLDTHGGRTWAYVYDTGLADVDAVGERAYVEFLHHNGLDPTVFPSLLRLENEVVGIAAAHLSGGPGTVGTFTSGGTESCMLAVKTARDHARATRGVTRPRVVLPETAHAAFQKGAHYFGVEPVLVPVDPATFKADADAVAAAIDDDTVLVVASAPSYAHGVVDPIGEIGARCAERGVPLHVDACIGGWLLPYLARLGLAVEPFDFTVPGVTSISMDFHKYAYCPKGASVLLFRDAAMRAHQLYACATWTGYTVVNTTIQSTKTGGALAATWATLQFVGDHGYLEIARRTQEATVRILDGVAQIAGLRVLGTPDMSLIALASDEFDVFEVVDEMRERGWYVQPQLRSGSSPPNIHLTVTGTSLERVDALLADLAEACEAARARPRSPETQALLDGLAQLDPDVLPTEADAQMLALAGLGDGADAPDVPGEAPVGGALPARMAGINAMLDALAPALRERLLVAFLNELYRPT